MAKASTVNKSEAIRTYLEENPKAKPKDVVAALSGQGVEVTTGFVAQVKSATKKKAKEASRKAKKAKGDSQSKAAAEGEKRKYLERPYPQKTLEALRIPLLIKEKNGGNPWATTDLADALGYSNLRWTPKIGR